MAFDVEKAQEERKEIKERRGEKKEKFVFDVTMFIPERGDYLSTIIVPKNDPELAKKVAIDNCGHKYPQQVEARLVQDPQKQ